MAMKRISPLLGYAEDEDYHAYPSVGDLVLGARAVSQHALTRRRFLGRLTAAAAGATGILLGPGKTRAAPAPGAPGAQRTRSSQAARREPQRIRIDLVEMGDPRVVAQWELRPDRLDLFLLDPELVRFFTDPKERKGVTEAASKAASRSTDEDFWDGKRLYALERSVSKALCDHLRRRMGRRVSGLDLMLYAGHPRNWRVRPGGVVGLPLRPVYP